jgi:DNA-directed RNA polymerase subunit RPC12/RpoP
MGNKAAIKCPSCGSEEISKPRLSGLAFAISYLLLAFPLPFLSRKYHCFDCGLDFKKKRLNG